MEEEIHHQDDQENGDDQGLYDVVNSRIEEVIRGLQDRKFQTSRHGLFDLVIKVVDCRIDLRSIGSRRLVDHECYTGLAVHAGGEAVIQCSQLHIRYIAQMKHVTMIRTEDDRLKLLDGLQTTFVLQVILIRIPALLA